MKSLKWGLISVVTTAVLLTAVFVSQISAVEINWLEKEDISNMPPTTVRYWYYETPEMTALGKQEKKKFEKLYPNIKVDGRTAPSCVDNWELMSFVVGGTNSHIHQSVNNESLWYITHDMLLPLEGLPGFKEDFNRFPANTTWKWKDGHYYALPWYGDTYMIMYDKKAVKEAGLNINNPPEYYGRFLEWAKKLTKKDARGKIIRSAAAIDPREAWWRFIVTGYNFYVAATGSGDYISKDGKRLTINDTPLQRKPFELIYDLCREGYFATEVFKVNPVYSGLTAMNIGFGPGNIGDIKRNAPPGFEYFLGPVPRPKESPVKGFVSRLFVREFVLMRERHLKGEAAVRTDRAAWEYMRFLLKDQQLANMYKTEGIAPCVKTLGTDPLFTNITETYDPQLKQLFEARKNAVPMDTNSVKTCEVQGILTLMVVKIEKGMEPGKALAWAEKEANKILK